MILNAYPQDRYRGSFSHAELQQIHDALICANIDTEAQAKLRLDVNTALDRISKWTQTERPFPWKEDASEIPVRKLI